MTDSRFPLAEVGLAKSLGVDRSVLRSIRKNLKKGVDWVTAGKSIQWSLEAAQKTALGLGVDFQKHATAVSPVNEARLANDEALMKKTEPEKTALVLTVVRRCVNPHVLVAREKNGPEIFVNVVSNANFRAGMEFRGEKTASGFRLVGRTPRFVGRW